MNISIQSIKLNNLSTGRFSCNNCAYINTILEICYTNSLILVFIVKLYYIRDLEKERDFQNDISDDRQ